MSDPQPSTPSFAIKTQRLVLLPSPLAIQSDTYKDLYASLHRMPEFARMAFGAAWGIKDWDQKTITPIIEREIQRSWRVRKIGDFAVGLRSLKTESGGYVEQNTTDVLGVCAAEELGEVEWIGYVGVRDATTTSMPSEPTSVATTREWTEMIELRYGFHPDTWGKGYGTEAAKAVTAWCKQEVGAKRFIAETERENKGSGKILGKLGFVEIDEREEIIWGMDGTMEWERRV